MHDKIKLAKIIDDAKAKMSKTTQRFILLCGLALFVPSEDDRVQLVIA